MDGIFEPMLEANIGDSSGGGDVSGSTPAPSTTESTPAPAAPTTTPAPSPVTPAPRTFSETDLRSLDLRELARLRGGDLFDQKALDGHVQGRLARERQAQATLMENMQRQYDARLAELTAAKEAGASPEALAPFIAEFQQIREQHQNLQLERTLDTMSKKYADFGPNHMDILQIALDHQVGVELAYKIWKYEDISKIDVEDVKKKAVDEYVKGKTTQFAKGPKAVEGSGGSAPVESEKHDGSWETAERRAKERFERDKNS